MVTMCVFFFYYLKILIWQMDLSYLSWMYGYLDVEKVMTCLVTSTKLDVFINQTFYSRIPQKNTFKNIICIKQSNCPCLQLFQTTIRTGLVHKKWQTFF